MSYIFQTDMRSRWRASTKAVVHLDAQILPTQTGLKAWTRMPRGNNTFCYTCVLFHVTLPTKRLRWWGDATDTFRPNDRPMVDHNMTGADLFFEWLMRFEAARIGSWSTNPNNREVSADKRISGERVVGAAEIKSKCAICSALEAFHGRSRTAPKRSFEMNWREKTKIGMRSVKPRFHSSGLSQTTQVAKQPFYCIVQSNELLIQSSRTPNAAVHTRTKCNHNAGHQGISFSCNAVPCRASSCS